MSREDIYKEMKEMLGKVPGFFASMPDDCIESEWQLFKRFELSETTIPPKYRELIGAAVASAQRCWYCSTFHTTMAEFHGATKDEIQEAVHLSKFGSGWSAYMNGTLYDRKQFLLELEEIGAYITHRHK